MSLRGIVRLFDDQTDPRGAQMHANARLTVRGRMIMVERIAAGRPIAHVAAEMGIVRKTAAKWWRRWLEGLEGLADRSSRPRRCPHRTSDRLERQIVRLRRQRKLGPARIASIVGVPTSTVHRVLCRHALNRLSWMDRPTGQVIRRIHTDHPGQLVHVDVKKLGRIPPGGGWRALGRGNTRQHQEKTRVGYDFVHSAVDAYSRLAYSEILTDERGPTCAAFWERAQAFFADHYITVDAVLTDNAKNYLGRDFTAALGSIRHRRIRFRRPQTNGKVERFNRTLLDEWAYARLYTSNGQRHRTLDRWLHLYNHHRGHTALGGEPPISRTNVPGQRN